MLVFEQLFLVFSLYQFSTFTIDLQILGYLIQLLMSEYYINGLMMKKNALTVLLPSKMKL